MLAVLSKSYPIPFLSHPFLADDLRRKQAATLQNPDK